MSCIRIITVILLTLGLCACNGEVTADVPSETVSSAETREADLSGISQTPLYITQVLHKTHIDLDSGGTRAAAVTAVIVGNGGLMQEFKEVYLNRPFLYIIVDTATNLPIFVGTVTGF